MDFSLILLKIKGLDEKIGGGREREGVADRSRAVAIYDSRGKVLTMKGGGAPGPG